MIWHIYHNTHTQLHLSLVYLLFTLQLLLHVLHCDDGCQDTAQKQGREEDASPPHLPLSKYLHHCIPSPGIVLEQSLQLEHGAHGQKQVEDLVTMTHNVTLAWEEAFRDGTGEEDGGQQEGDDVESVERK